MSEKKTHKVLWALFAFTMMMLPFLFLKRHHNCHEDECFRIFYEGRLGMCVQDAIDTTCGAISFLTFVAFLGSAVVWSRKKNALSPFVFMAMLLTLAVFIAFIDPSRWEFVISIFIPIAAIIGVKIYDNMKAS